LGHLQTCVENEGTIFPSQAGYDGAMKLASRLCILLVLVLLACCKKQNEQKAQFFVFGTIVDVVTRDADEATNAAAFTELQQRFQAMHRDWHAWEPGTLMEINDAFSQGNDIAVPADIRTLIEHSQEMETLSDGRFNAAAGALIELWGFHTSEFPVSGPVPDETSITILLDTAPSANDIVFEGERAHSLNPMVQLDFGGIAKGYAVDIAIEILQQHGIENALVNAGGDLKAIGGSIEQPWGVGIGRPVGGFYGGVKIAGNEAVFTSGVDQRYLEEGENWYPHIIDPRTGQAVQGIISATVIAEKGYYADAAATALMVAGTDSWLEVVKSLELDTVMIVDDDGMIFMTPKMSERLLPKKGTDLQATIVEP
jgi:thiamine biosynthesis lipoprotein